MAGGEWEAGQISPLFQGKIARLWQYGAMSRRQIGQAGNRWAGSSGRPILPSRYDGGDWSKGQLPSITSRSSFRRGPFYPYNPLAAFGGAGVGSL